MFKSKKKSKSSVCQFTRRTKRLELETCEERRLMAFGAEFTIGSEFTANQEVATASAENGTSVAVWTVTNSNGDSDILGQLYNADGTERGSILPISTGASKDSQPAVAMEDNGDFTVSFTRQHNHGFLNLSVDQDIHVRRFNGNGVALGGTITVSGSNSEQAFESDIAMDANGDFVVAYTAETIKTRTVSVFGFPVTQSFTDRDVRGRRFSSGGIALGDTFSIDSSAAQFEQNASVAMADDGRFVVAYEDGSNIHLRQFNANGGLRRTLSIASTSRSERNPDVAVDAAGNAIVVWQDATGGTDIRARRVTDGGSRGATIAVRATSDFENNPSVAITQDGNSVIVGYNREIHSDGLVADHIDTTRLVRSGNNLVIQGHQTHGQGMESPSVSVDGNDRFFVGYVDRFEQQTEGRWGQMGASAPTDKTAHDFRIDLSFSGFTASQRNIFRQAADRWEQVIVGDLPEDTFNGINVDDVLIDASSVAIDGVNGILGQAGPDQLRSGSSLPVHGVMRFDTADINSMEIDGTLFNVILHEMGHVLGIGTLWSTLGLASGLGTANPIYTGVNGVAGFNAARGFLGLVAPATSVPIEADGGPGTQDAHWDEVVFDTELMTGFVESAGVTMPLSRMTVGSLDDMGYQVSYAAADNYAVPLFVVPNFMVVGFSNFSGIRADPNAEFADPLAEDSRQCEPHTQKLLYAQQDVDSVFEHMFKTSASQDRSMT